MLSWPAAQGGDDRQSVQDSPLEDVLGSTRIPSRTVLTGICVSRDNSFSRLLLRSAARCWMNTKAIPVSLCRSRRDWLKLPGLPLGRRGGPSSLMRTPIAPVWSDFLYSEFVPKIRGPVYCLRS